MTELAEGWQEHEDVKALIEAERVKGITSATGGLVSKRDELLAEVHKLKDKMKEFGDLDPEKAKEALAKMEEQGDKKLIDEGKIEELVETRIGRMKDDFSTQLKAQEDARVKDQDQIKYLKNELSETTIEEQIRKAIEKTNVKIHASAWQDIISRGKQVFKINDKGVAEPRDKDGKILIGKDAVNPLTFEEWGESLRETAPHIWDEEPLAGSGSSGNKQSGEGGSITLSKADSQDVGKYRQARELAEKKGVPLQVE